MSDLQEILLSEILPTIERPSRYLGREWNSIHKDPGAVKLRIALFFPDLYELGLGNLGLHILYGILNAMEGVWAERAYTPAPDMEAVLRARRLPLFLHESKDPLGSADLIGFTLQSELTYVNILNAIDLAGFPVRAADRGEDAPLFIAGGPTAANPEPMAPFFDAFVIGEGEEVIVEIAEALLPLRRAPRTRRLEALASIPGVYVPALHPTLVEEGVIYADPSQKITRRVIDSLNTAYFPENPIVPFTKLIHDGVGIEVLRGCTQGCRFCQAGMVSRPVRERHLDRIGDLLEKSIRRSGLEASTLVSLSTCDYSQARTMVRQAAERVRALNASVSLPSLRLDSFAVELADMVAGMRRSGLTFAPEAATPRMRAVINKMLSDDDLIRMAEEAFRRGWEHIKTYFMIGLPTETEEDVRAIADLCLRTLDAGRRIRRGAMVRTGVSTFVPKPHTPFQWAEQIGIEETMTRQRILMDIFRPYRGIKFGRHNPAASYIEGMISRADRRAADLIEAAWRLGAGHETWEEKLNITPWKKAIEATGYDEAHQLRERSADERLPWDHIDMLVDRAWLAEEWRRAQALDHGRDCRQEGCRRCGVNRQAPQLCAEMLRRSEEGRIADEEIWQDLTALAEPVRPEAVQRLRFRIGRRGEARLLSHLETAQVWIRALRRAEAPMAYSQGFHAHPKVTFATAAPLGEESTGDLMDVLLAEAVVPSRLLKRLAENLPMDFCAEEAWEVPLRAASLMASVTGFDYRLYTPLPVDDVRKRITDLMAQPEIVLDRTVKSRGTATGRKAIVLDLKPLIHTLDAAESDEPGKAIIHFSTRIQGERLAKTREIMTLLCLDPAHTRVVRIDTRIGE